jgi:hypothetical protein
VPRSKNEWSYTTTPNTPSWRGAQLKKKHMDNFSFTFYMVIQYNLMITKASTNTLRLTFSLRISYSVTTKISISSNLHGAATLPTVFSILVPENNETNATINISFYETHKSFVLYKKTQRSYS